MQCSLGIYCPACLRLYIKIIDRIGRYKRGLIWMQYAKDYVYKIATNLDVKSCRIFLLMWSMSDDEGNVATSLGQINKETGLAVSTVRDAFASLQKAGLLQIEHEVGVKANYKLLYPKEIIVEEKPKRRRAKSKPKAQEAGTNE